MSETSRKITVPQLRKMKQAGQPIAMLTAYDYAFAKLLDEAGIDVLLVGDSLAMVVQGHGTTLPVTLDEMIYHGEMVARAAKRALVVVDMPFPENHLGKHQAVASAGRILKETRAQAVKLEGGADQAEVIAALVAAGIPVMAHVGLRPQSVHVMGGYRVQRDIEILMRDASMAEQAGAFAVVLECIPRDVARTITGELQIPTIGIGAGPDCDGQVLVVHDLLGITSGYVPSFVQQYAQLGESIRQAASTWRRDVQSKSFPSTDHSFQ
ncbi:MAG TPA: 3-methyl-2-oxobutanoate hydroxymethyltransferase [Pirellulaceae bacterium]|nr:3-methyl-2-oxobutanoate hydroxymethyltransferase [Pirellulaceae bacterium]